jgi:hypothetical protein
MGVPIHTVDHQLADCAMDIVTRRNLVAMLSQKQRHPAAVPQGVGHHVHCDRLVHRVHANPAETLRRESSQVCGDDSILPTLVI